MPAGRNIFQGFARGALGRAPLDQPAPAKVSLVAIEPVALRFARLPCAAPFGIARPRIAQRFAHHQCFEGSLALVVHDDAVVESLARGGIA